MRNGNLTPKERDVIQQLLAKHNITAYEIVGAEGEGKSLPGSNYPCEIESLSGTVVTPTTAFLFWLDWNNNRYTLGEHDGTWQELAPAQIAEDEEILEAQRQLCQQ